MTSNGLAMAKTDNDGNHICNWKWTHDLGSSGVEPESIKCGPRSNPSKIAFLKAMPPWVTLVTNKYYQQNVVLMWATFILCQFPMLETTPLTHLHHSFHCTVSIWYVEITMSVWHVVNILILLSLFTQTKTP